MMADDEGQKKPRPTYVSQLYVVPAVDAVDAGKGQLEISVNQGRVPNNVQMQGAGRCLVTFIPQYPGKYIIDVTFNGEQVQGCPIRVDILSKQVGQSVSTPIISQQTASITPAAYKSGSIVRSAERLDAPASPSLISHLRQRSSEQLHPEHPRSPVLVQQAEQRSFISSRWESSSRQSSSPRPLTSPQMRISPRSPSADSDRDRSWERPRLRDSEEMESSSRSDSRLGYTVAQYGSEKPKTVSSRTLTDDGRGTVTSTFTSETRYKQASPSRTFEFSRGTLSTLADEGRAAVPTSYAETRAFEAETYPVPLPPKDYDGAQPTPRKTEESVVSGGFVTDSRSYGFTSDESGDATRGGRYGLPRKEPAASVPLKYFGDEGVADGKPTARESPKAEIPLIATTYEKFRDRGVDLTKYDTVESTTSTAYTYDAGRLRSNGRLKQESDPKDSAYSTSSFGTFERRVREEADDRAERFPPPPPVPEPEPTILKRTEDMKPSAGDWRPSGLPEIAKPERHFERKPFEEEISQTRRKAEDEDFRLREAMKPGRSYERKSFEYDIGRRDDDEDFQRKADADMKPSSWRRDLPEHPPKYDSPLDSLHRANEVEQSALPAASQRTAEYLRAMLDAGAGDRVPPPPPPPTDRAQLDSRLSYEIDEPEGNIPSNVVEKALTPRSKRKILERTLNKEADLDETFDSIREEPKPLQTLDKDEQLPQSKPVTPKQTPKTTPKLGLKFGKDLKDQKLFDFGKSKFSSKHEVVRRGKDIEVKLESLKLGKEDQLRVVVIPPPKANEERVEIDPKVKKSRNNYEISFKANEVGTHKVMAYVNNIVHPLSPFPIRVYDASEIIVGEIPAQSTISDTVEFTVDAGRAGFGNLEMAIKDSENVIIPSHVAQLETGTAKFLVTFNPTSVGMHTVNITFNKEVLKNSPFQVNITEAKTDDILAVEGKKPDSKKEREEKKREEKEKLKKEKEEKQETLKRTKLQEKESKKKKQGTDKKTSVKTIPSLSRVGKPAELSVSTTGDEQLDVVVLDPFKNTLESEISEQENGLKKVQFTPTHVGDHEIDIKYGGVDVQGSPFTCRAYDPAKIVVGEIPSGVIDKAVHFVVDASEAGVGNLEVAVNEGRIPSMAQSLGQHRYDISFVPREQIDHTVSVRFNNEPVPGSPFTCRLVSPQSATASGTGLERIPVGQIASFFVTIESDRRSVPTVRVVDAHGEQVPAKVSAGDATGKFVVEYTPMNVGNHQIDVECEGEPITGSPFVSKAFDATCARLSRVETAVVGQPCTFTIDAARAGAGNMEIIVSVENRNVPNFVQAEGQAKFRVSFTPLEAKNHVISVRFNGQPIPGSPMTCSVAERPSHTPLGAVHGGALGASGEAEQIRLVGELATGQVGQVKGFSIDTGGRNAECNVVVTDPDGNDVDVQLEKVLNGYHVQFIPVVPGEHEVDIQVDGRSLGVGPFVVDVSDPPKVSRLPSIVFIGKKLAFEIDTGRGGRGDVQVEVSGEDGRQLPVHTEVDSRGIVRASCRFRNVGRHTVDVLLNGKALGEKQVVNVVEPSRAASLVSDIDRARVGQSSRIALRADDTLGKHLVVVVNDAEGSQIPVSLQSIAEGLYEAEFIPKSEGDHSLAVMVGDEHIKGSPFRIGVLDLSAVRVIGLKNDRIGVEQRFNVDWSNSGGSEASVRVTREGKEVPSSVKKVKPGLHVCSFTPKQVGLHLIDVMIDGVLLPECPYECIINDMGSVRARGDSLTRAQRGKTARFEVSMSNAVRGELDVLIADSHGGPLPVRCYKQHDDSYWVEFTPEEIGLHRIEVTFADVPVAGSPFKCEVVDPRKVLIKGVGEPLLLRQVANISVNREMAGNGELTIDVVDPSGQSLKVDVLKSPSGDDKVSFLPVKLGQHKFSAKLAGFQVSGTPQTIVVEEQGKPSVSGNAIENAVEIDHPASIIFDAKKLKGGLKVDVKGPKKTKVRHSAIKRSDGTTEILFTPTEVGRYSVSVEFNGKPINGSPYNVEVVDCHKVIVNDEAADDNGVFHFAVQQRNIIDVDATAAGSGKLRAEVRDWEGKMVGDCDVESLGYGKCRVLFQPHTPGKYNIYLYWAEVAVESAFPLHAVAEPEQPSTSRAAPLVAAATTEAPRHARSKSGERERPDEDDEAGDHLRVVLRGEGLSRALLNEHAEFIVDASDTSREGRVACSLIGQKADVPVRLTHLGNNVYKAVYTPVIPGTYELQVMWDNRHVRGSPFRVHVDSHTSPAELIHVDTSTLKIGIINEDVKTVIDTRRAGPGQLSAQCMGPSKLAYCELYDHRDGTYTLSVRPSEVGKHTLVVKYSDEHVPGSPFVINVSHQPDASKVRVYGPGIEHGILSTFKSNFVVETKGAGAGQLTVRVRGPKGAFNVEMQREKKQERTIHCKYEPREPGDYQVEVKWHGEHVPGSPFLVMIVDTEQELQRFLRGDAPSPQPATPFIPPGWIGAPPPPLFLGPGAPRGPYPPHPHPSLPPPHGPHGAMIPYGPPPSHAMRTGVRSRYANGY